MTEHVPEPVANPYVGPRTFTEAQRRLFFGREREARDLTAGIVSERLLLFYAQSGAGKSSLLNTRVIPNLRDVEGFQVLPVGRVSGELPEGIDSVANIFAFNLMSSLDQGEGYSGRLADVNLSDFLARLAGEPVEDTAGTRSRRWVYKPEVNVTRQAGDTRHAAKGPRFALVIDQFEEIITSHPGRWREREAFFRQLNQALLDDPNLWVVLTLREDYVAALDPYAALLFNRLRARFYMERMQVSNALEAIRRPAELAGRPFAPGVAEQLVDNLRQVRVAGQEQPIPGQYVQPVQLQVVCYQLWENLDPLPDRLAGEEGEAVEAFITFDDLEEAGDVDRALVQFYEETIAGVLADEAVQAAFRRQALAAWAQAMSGPEAAQFIWEKWDGRSALETGNGPLQSRIEVEQIEGLLAAFKVEPARDIRRWFDQELITEAGTRGLVHQGEKETAGLPNAVVRALEQRFLVRAEARAGDAWIELVHDRFVEPIRECNRAWFTHHLDPLTTAARAWRDAGKPAKLLYTGSQLAAAAVELEARPADFEELERSFVAASKEAESRRASRRQRRLTWGAIALAVIFIGLAVWALFNARNANESREIAEAARREAAQNEQLARRSLAGQLAAQAWALGGQDKARGELLAVEAVKQSKGNFWDVPSALNYLHAARGATEVRKSAQKGSIRALDLSPDAGLLLSGDDANLSLVNDPLGQVTPPTVHLLTNEFITALDVSDDHRWLAVASAPAGDEQRRNPFQTIGLWRLTEGKPERLDIGQLGSTAAVLQISPNIDWIVAGGNDGRLYLWELSTPSKAGVTRYDVAAHQGPVSALAFSPNGRWLVSGGQDGLLRIWSFDDLTSGGKGGDISNTLSGHSAAIVTLAASDDGRWLASGDSQGGVRVWRLPEGFARWPGRSPDATAFPTLVPVSSSLNIDDITAESLTGHEGGVTALAFSPGGRWLVTAGADGVVRRWDAGGAGLVGADDLVWWPTTLRGHQGAVNAVAFEANGYHLFTGGDDDKVIIWNVASASPDEENVTLPTPTRVIALTTGGPSDRYLVVGLADGSVHMWDLSITALMEAACQRAGRNLTAQEWRESFSGQDYRKVCEQFPIHPSVVQEHVTDALEFAGNGDVIEARAAYEKALALDPQLGIDPETEIVRQLVQTGRELARQGQIDTAMARYRRAAQQDESLALNTAELEDVAEAQSVLRAARELAQGCNTEEAVAEFSRAQALDPSLELDVEGLVRSLCQRARVSKSASSDFIYGFHEPGGEYLMLAEDRPGWIVFREAIGHDPNDRSGKDYSQWSDRGLGIIVVLANGYLPEGTLPFSSDYGDFAQRCRNFVAASKGAGIWVIGNEMNHPVEWPGATISFQAEGVVGQGVGTAEPITPALYADAFRRCRQAILAVPGHEEDLVLAGAVAPWINQLTYEGNPNGDWVQYFQEILAELGPQGTDGFTLHTYTLSEDPALLSANIMMAPPFEDHRHQFRAYRDFMEAVPKEMRHLAAFITETSQNVPWLNANTGWVQAAYREIDEWNSDPAHQPIRSLVLYRWPKLDQWYIEGKQGVIEDFQAALAHGYSWRNPPPPISFVVDDLPKHPKLTYEQRPLSQITHLVVHSTAVPTHVSADRLAQYHVETLGYPGIAYHYYIAPDGTIEQVNRLESVAYHTTGANDYAVGIAFSGQFDESIPTDEQIESGARLIAWLMQRFSIPLTQVLGQKEMAGNDTNDPGRQWLEGQNWKDILLLRVQGILENPDQPAAAQ